MPDYTEEMLDIYDDNMQWTGTKTRTQVHADGDWHRVFHCWVIYKDAAGIDWIVMQRRGYAKAVYPGYLDVSAAGHLAAGESVADGVRELHEELGLLVAFDALIPAGKRITAYRYGDIIEREVADVFFCIQDQPLSSYDYQREEVAGLVAIPVEQGIALFAFQMQSITVPATESENPSVSLTRDDFIPSLDQYVYKIFLLARRCLRGEDHLLI